MISLFFRWLDVRVIFLVNVYSLSLYVGLFCRFYWKVVLWFFRSRLLYWYFEKCSDHCLFCYNVHLCVLFCFVVWLWPYSCDLVGWDWLVHGGTIPALLSGSGIELNMCFLPLFSLDTVAAQLCFNTSWWAIPTFFSTWLRLFSLSISLVLFLSFKL